MSIHCLLVDDHMAAMEMIAIYAKQFPELIIIGMETDAQVAMEKLKKGEYSPDLIFLDISMPGLSGIEFAAMLKGEIPIVFTTATNNFATEAFEVGAIDYLLKPFSFRRFDEAIQKFKAVKERQVVDTGTREFLQVPGGRKKEIIRIKKSTIIYVEAKGNYTHIITENDKTVITYRSISQIEELLPESEFLRISRSFIVNMNKVEKVTADSIFITGDVELPIGQVYKTRVSEIFDL